VHDPPPHSPDHLSAFRGCHVPVSI